MSYVGFGLIITSIIIYIAGSYLNVNSNLNIDLKDFSWLTGISGIITEFLSVVCYAIYKQSHVIMKEYHNSLVALQNTLITYWTAQGIENDEHKFELLKNIK